MTETCVDYWEFISLSLRVGPDRYPRDVDQSKDGNRANGKELYMASPTFTLLSGLSAELIEYPLVSLVVDEVKPVEDEISNEYSKVCASVYLHSIARSPKNAGELEQ
jgi:hypothetical protein